MVTIVTNGTTNKEDWMIHCFACDVNFHAKCIGFNGSLADKVNTDTGFHYYYEAHKSVSVKSLLYKLNCFQKLNTKLKRRAFWMNSLKRICSIQRNCWKNWNLNHSTRRTHLVLKFVIIFNSIKSFRRRRRWARESTEACATNNTRWHSSEYKSRWRFDIQRYFASFFIFPIGIWRIFYWIC